MCVHILFCHPHVTIHPPIYPYINDIPDKQIMIALHTASPQLKFVNKL